MTNRFTMDYAEFGRLRFRDFFPETECYFKDEVGGTTCGIGLACVDGYGFSGFASPTRSPGKTAEIALDFAQDCPVSEGEAFLRFLGLNLRKGMGREEVIASLGQPESERPDYLRFVVGTRWPFYIGCKVRAGGGLQKVWICRKDLADEEANRLKLNTTGAKQGAGNATKNRQGFRPP